MNLFTVAIVVTVLSATAVHGAPSLVMSELSHELSSKTTDKSLESASMEEILDEIASSESKIQAKSNSGVDQIELWRQDFRCKLESIRFVVEKAIEDDEDNKVKFWAHPYYTKLNEISADWKMCSKIDDELKHKCETSVVSEALPLFIEFFNKLISVSQIENNSRDIDTYHAQDTRHSHP